MAVDSLIVDLTLIMMSAAAVTLVFRKLKQPVVLGYILAGFLISPNFEYFPTVIGSEDMSYGQISVSFFSCSDLGWNSASGNWQLSEEVHSLSL